MIYSSVSSINRLFTVKERPLAEDGNPSGLDCYSGFTGKRTCDGFEHLN